MRQGPVSSLAPAARLLCLLFLMPGLFASWDVVASALLAAAILGLALEGLTAREFLGEVPALLYLIAFLVLIQSLRFSRPPYIDPVAMLVGLRYGLRLLAAFALGRLFYKSTTSSELREGTMALGRFLPGNFGRELGLGLSLVLGFIPGIILEWRLSLEAGKARGIVKGSPFLLRLKVIEAFLRRLILGSINLPEALAARGWTGRALRGRRWSPVSWVAVAGCAGFSLAALWLLPSS